MENRRPPVVASVFGGNLGDTLWTTPLSRYVGDRGLIVQMRKGDAKAMATAPILRGLARVEWVDSPKDTPRTTQKVHVTQQILGHYGYAGLASIPRVRLDEAEIFGAIKFLKSKGLDPARTIAMVNQNSASADPGNFRAQYVRPPSDVIKTLARFWGGGQYKIAQFGPDPKYYTYDPFDPIPNAVHIRGLTVRQLASVYHVIGKLISGDTGDYHLMLAVGGKAACLVPPDSTNMGYLHSELLYDKVCWGDERPRVCYALHQNWIHFMDTKLFDRLS